MKITLYHNRQGYFVGGGTSVCCEAMKLCFGVSRRDKKATVALKKTCPKDAWRWERIKMVDACWVTINDKMTRLYVPTDFHHWRLRKHIPETFWVKKVS